MNSSSNLLTLAGVNIWTKAKAVQANDDKTVRQVSGHPGADNTELVLRDVIRMSDKAIARRHMFYPRFL